MVNNTVNGNINPYDLPPAVLAGLPALAPPPGVTPNFFNPPSRADLAKGSIYTFLPLMVVFVFLRTYARTKASRSFGLDDGELEHESILKNASTIANACQDFAYFPRYSVLGWWLEKS